MDGQYLGFQKDVVRIPVGEFDQLVFDAGAIAGADTLNLPVVEGRFRQRFVQNLMHFRIGVHYPTRALAEFRFLGGEE